MKIPALGSLTKVEDYSGGDYNDWKSEPIPVPFFAGAKSEFIIIESYETEAFASAVNRSLDTLFSVDETMKPKVAAQLFTHMQNFMDSVEYEFVKPDPVSEERVSWDSDHEHERRLIMNKLRQIDLRTVTTADQVWSAVHPFEIMVSAVEGTDQSDVYVQVHLKTGWDDEHGIEFVLKNGTELVYVGEPVWPLTDYELNEYKTSTH